MATTAEQFAEKLGERTNLFVDDDGYRRPLRDACNRARAKRTNAEDANGDMHTTYTFPDCSSIIHHVPNVGDCYWTIG